MKIVALEEHAVSAPIRDAWIATADRQDASVGMNRTQFDDQLEDLGEHRLAAMDAAGIDVQVLSLPSPGLQNFTAAEAVPLATAFNDFLARVVARRPDRFEAFATLPVADPEASARELERAVRHLGMKGALMNGRVGERNMDAAAFEPIYEAAAALGVPLYIHPQIPRREVVEAYYTGFDPKTDLMFSMGAVGWHYDAGMQLLRMVMSGLFDRHPNLQVIVGHWGEVILFYLDRIKMLDHGGLKLQRPIKKYFRTNVHYTPSGIFAQSYLNWAIETVGIDRIMFSQDYPYQSARDGGARKFLEQAAVTDAERAAIAHGNWERLLKIKR